MTIRTMALCALLACGAMSLGSGPVQAESQAERAVPATGPVTGLPLPRFVSLKAAEARARRGPSTTHRIDWVYQRRGLPLMVTAEHGHWRRVEDVEGQGGWVHYALLTGTRRALVLDDLTTVRARPGYGARERAHLEAGVIATLGECETGWCRVAVGDVKGWVPAGALWGAGG